MKNIIHVIALVISFHVCAQTEIKNSNIFVRVYDLNGKKIGKGEISSYSENFLYLSRKEELIKISIKDIDIIKTKHSAGNNILIGATAGAVLLAVIVGANAKPNANFFAYTIGEGAALGSLVGGIFGATIGGISILFKNAQSYEINCEVENLNAFMGIMGK